MLLNSIVFVTPYVIDNLAGMAGIQLLGLNKHRRLDITPLAGAHNSAEGRPLGGVAGESRGNAEGLDATKLTLSNVSADRRFSGKDQVRHTVPTFLPFRLISDQRSYRSQYW